MNQDDQRRAPPGEQPGASNVAEKVDVATRLERLSPKQLALLARHMEIRGREKGTVAPAGAPAADAGPGGLRRAIPRISRDRDPPLSFGQERLWFLNRLEPESATYNMPGAVRLQGGLSVEHLDASLREVVRRHEVLRTTYEGSDESPRQVAHERYAFDVSVVDVSGIDASAREAVVADCAVREARRPFDLARGPVVRAQLVRVGSDEHVLLFTMHHIASDGWSMGVLVREVAVLYDAYAAGQPSPLPELPIQYADYGHWQRSWLSGEVLERRLEHWKGRLAGAPAALELPTDRPRPKVKSDRGARIRFDIDADTTRGLRELARHEGATLFMVLLAAWQVLLARYSGQRDIVVGTPIANRTRADVEGVIGFFVNTLALRTEVSGACSFRDTVARVKETCLAAYAHQDVPFERVVDELSPARDLSRTPLFQVMLVLQNVPRRELGLRGLTLNLLELDSGTSKFDLTLGVSEHPDGFLEGTIVYDSTLWDAPTILRMSRHLQRLVEAAIADADAPVASLPLLTDTEAAELLRWNGTRAEYAGASRIEAVFDEQLGRTPDAVAVACDDHQLTYAELGRRATVVSLRLREVIAPNEPRVGLCARRSVETMIGWLGILKAGAAYVPFDEAQPIDRLERLARDAGISALLIGGADDGGLRSRLLAAVLQVGDAERSTIGATPTPGVSTSPSHAAYVIYTSGSTGQPKGVCVPHRAVINLQAALAAAIRPYASGRPLRVSQNGPLTFDTSVKQLVQLLGGHTVVVIPEEVRYDGTALLAYARAQAVDVLDCTPVQLRALVESESSIGPLPSCLLVAGEAIGQDTWERLAGDRRLEAYNLYGPTECTVDSTVAPVAGGSPTIGRPLANVRTYVLDSERRPTPVGVVGELWIGGEGVAVGYLNSPALTAEKFAPCTAPDARAGERCYATGDLVRYFENGSIDFRGRVDHQHKLRGYRIELGEIEQVVGAHPAVRAVVAAVHEVSAADHRLVAYWTSADGCPPRALQELREHTARLLPDYMVPSAFVHLDRLPLTATGKIDRRALPEPEFVAASDFVGPRDGLETLLAEIWAEVLRVPNVGVHDDFFELGGHSLLATQVVSRIRRALDLEIPLRTAFEATTVAALADRVRASLYAGGGAQAAPPIQRIARAGTPPVSFGQERLWFLDQLEPNSSAYNVPAAVRLRGRLRFQHLVASLQEVVRRHEVLRTTYDVAQGAARQVIHASFTVDVPVVDASAMDSKLLDAFVRDCAVREARRPFDLHRGPVVRAQLLRLGDEEHVLLFTLHHIASDAWSTGVLVREVAALYEAHASGRASPLSEPPIQYADYAQWQRNWLSGEVLEAQLAYWKGRLAGAPAALDLPTDRPRPRVKSHLGASVAFEVSTQLTARLRELGRQEGATLFMVLLAAWQVLLARYSGQRDIVVGSPIANRSRTEVEGLIGFFVNTLALRTEVSGHRTLRETIAMVKEACLGAYAHQDVPFERVVDELSPARDLSRTPLFQTMLVLQNVPRRELSLPGLTLSLLELDGGTSKFDLTLSLSEGTQGGLHGTISYDTSVFEPSTILRLSAHLTRVLDAQVETPELRVSELGLVTDSERHSLLVEWNDTAEPNPGGCLHELFEAQVARTPDAVAVVFEDEQLTFAELDGRANQLARRLRDLGAAADSVIAICVEHSIRVAVALMGVLKSGSAYAMLDIALPAERRRVMLADMRATLAITDGGSRQDSFEGVTQVDLDGDWDSIARDQARTALPARTDAGQLAYVLYTSGSTGRPKGVAIPHRQVVSYVAGVTTRLSLPVGESFATVSTFAADLGNTTIFPPLCFGGTLHIVSRDRAMDSEAFAAYMSSRGVSCLKIVPSHLAALLSSTQCADALPSRSLVLGGEASSWELVERIHRLRPGCDVANHYGPTETTVGVSTYAVEVFGRVPSATVPIGRPLPNSQLYVLDDELRAAPIGIPGQLYIGGAGLAWGYLQAPDRTARAFIPNPFGEVGSRLYTTGDRVKRLAESSVEFLGRGDNQVKIRGFRVELGEIESVLSSHPAVRECAAVACELDGDKRLVAYVVPADGPRASLAELRAHIAEQLPEHMVPSFFVALDALPRTPNGKVDRRALPAPQASGPADGYVAPRNPLEELVAGVFADVLHAPRVGAHDGFFELGGHSLMATRLVSQLRSVLGVQLPLRAVFEAPTVEALAARIRHESGSTQAAAQLEHRGELAVSYGQERIWFIQRLFPDDASYNLPGALRLRGEIDERALKRAFDIVIERHEVLRTCYRTVEGRLVVQRLERLELELPVEDLRGLTAAEREARTAEVVTSEKARLFDLETGPLLRARLLRTQERECVFVIVMHHIITDGWSMQVLAREVVTAYDATRRGQQPRLPELPIQYADFAIWQRAWLQGEERDRQLSYWERKLAGAPESLDLPSDFLRPEVQKFVGGREVYQSSSQLGQRIVGLARELGATPFMVLTAAFASLMARLVGSEEVVVGTPMANRPTPDTEKLIGFFMNSLALRIDVSGEPTFRELVRRVREVCLEGYAHQDVPFEQVLERVRPKRDLSRTPLFQVFLNLRSFGSLSPAPELDAERVEFAASGSKFDLTLYMRLEDSGPLEIDAVYNRGLFVPERMRTWLGQLEIVLERGTSEPDVLVSTIGLITDNDRRVLPDATELLDDTWVGSVHDRFSEQAARQPEALAVRDGGGSYSYGELETAASVLAAELQGHGVGLRTTVAVLAHRNAELVLAIMAILKAGAAFVMLDPNYPASRLISCMQRTAPRALLVLEPAAAAADALATATTELGAASVLVQRGAIRQLASSRPGAHLSTQVGPDDMAYVAFTSGTTGVPKGIMGRHGSLSHFIPWQREHFGFDESDRYSLLSGLAHDPLHRDVFTPLQTGGAVCVPDAPLVGDAAKLASWMAETGVTVTHLTPAMAQLLCEALSIESAPELERLRYAFLVGDVLRHSDVKRLRALAPNVRCVNYYGSTETQRAVSYFEVPDDDGQAAGPRTRVVPLGRGIPDVQLLVMPRPGQLAGVGEVGEIHVRSPHLALGYLNDERLTAERFVPNPFRQDEADRLYRTGDLGRYGLRGDVEPIGRADDQVQIRGFRVEPAEVASVLLSDPRVGEAVVVAADAGGLQGLRLYAYVVARHGAAAVNADDLLRFVRGRLPEYMVPFGVTWLPRLPLTPNGKVDRKALPTPQPPASVPGLQAAAPMSGLEQAIAEICRELLGADVTIGHDDNFFELGAHSLLISQAHARLQARLGRDIPLVAFFSHPTVRGLAQHLAEGPGNAGDAAAMTRGKLRGEQRKQRMAVSRARRNRS
jgi:amino acid adenylation domain-containing protein